MTYHFPDAYAGQNTKIRDTLNNLILKSPQNWQTSVGLPFFQIEGTVVEWDEVKFDVRLMQRVPYEGVSRMQTSLRRKHRDRVVRRCDAESGTVPHSHFHLPRAHTQFLLVSVASRSSLRATSTPPTRAARTSPTSLRRSVTGRPTPLLGHAPAWPRTLPPLPRVPRSVQETCNFDVLYACAATTQTGAAQVLERLVAPNHCVPRAQVPHGRELRLFV